MRVRLRMALAFSILAFSTLALSQQAASSSTSAAADEAREKWRDSRQSTLKNDFGEFARYRDANAALGDPATGENRVVFFGDSITDSWKLADSFPGKPYVNRGISGQTTQQMLLRFRADVINLKPKVVVILAGTNDIAGNTGPMTLEEIEANYSSMFELAHANHIQVVSASVLPVHNYTPESQNAFAQRSPAKIFELNRWMQDYCLAKGCLYLDYYSNMLDNKGMLRRELAEDGLHPNKAGYAIMAPLADQAIGRALALK